MISELTAEQIISANNILGEGPLWHPGNRFLYWVDITQGHIHSCDAWGGNHRVFEIGTMPGSLHLTAAHNKLVVTSPMGLLQFWTETGHFQVLGDPIKIPYGARFNDGKTDCEGRIWAGTMDLGGAPHRGALYRIESASTSVVVRAPMSIPNGLAWTLDNSYFYHIDSPTRTLQGATFEPETGELGLPETIANFEHLPGVPDGMCIDNEGNVWIAFWGGGQVCRFNPGTGKLLSRIRVPAPQVTSCCFGGENLDTLFITTARHGMTGEMLALYPQSGNVFLVHPDVQGRSEPITHGF